MIKLTVLNFLEISNLYIVEYHEFLNKPKFRNRILDTLFYRSSNLRLDVLFIHNS
ncbi:hypothetical protein LMANV2_20065 [Leptospira interrogans serovar Manilae]|uniref:Uncharacterized protein n=1 Tax=Leptospira interrogans serovar Manilae TaxID=214675 RepID=A0AAQ1NVA7_LEPIR|nr:hypothetical protein LMANV2_20065 [Leptospira interrogans serovar Manilae]